MMNSMTGYAKHEMENEDYKIKIEIKTVNNKNMNLKIKIPYFLNYMENKIRNTVSKYITRAYIDLRIDFEDKREIDDMLLYDKNFAFNYMNVLKQVEIDFNEKIENKVEFLLKQTSLIKRNEIELDENICENLVINTLEETMKKLNVMRKNEADELKKYFYNCINRLEDKLNYVKENKNKVTEEYRMKLIERLGNIREDIKFNENDILKEILLFTDRSDISEEISRLDSHIKHLKKEIESNEAGIGKKLDFILQEIFRELNTSGVKSNYYNLSEVIVEAKNEVEKIREQVQNIE